MNKFAPLCVATLSNRFGVTIDVETMDVLIRDDRKFLKMLERYYKPEHTSMDTADRDWLCDIVAKHLGYEHWPVNGDPESYSEDFKCTLIEYGYLKEDES